MNMKLPAYLQDEVKSLMDEQEPHIISIDTVVDFSEYMWMVEEEIEEFDKQVEEEFWEEAFIEDCFEEMLAEEEAQWQHYTPSSSSSFPSSELSLSSKSYDVKVPFGSKLNPNAPEFVPVSARKSKV